MDIKSFIIEYWKHVASQNELELKKYFHEDACIRWHNTNEEFNVSEFLRANCDYPEYLAFWLKGYFYNLIILTTIDMIDILSNISRMFDNIDTYKCVGR